MSDEDINDRELLELAAKAVNGGAWHPLTHEKPWNPLTDDGDALRLAVKLRLRISIDYEPGVIGVQWFMEHGLNRKHGLVCDPHGDDRNSALRRAIVRAGAEIGRRMP